MTLDIFDYLKKRSPSISHRFIHYNISWRKNSNSNLIKKNNISLVQQYITYFQYGRHWKLKFELHQFYRTRWSLVRIYDQVSHWSIQFTWTFNATSYVIILVIRDSDIQKSGLRRKSKVCPLDTQFKISGLRISHSKVFSSGLYGCCLPTGCGGGRNWGSL